MITNINRRRHARLLGTVISSAIMVAAVPAITWAQDTSSDAAEVDSLEEIVVTGFRSSLQAALSAKRDSVGSVDAIMAEDIADFPDLNLAESLQRIPGVSIRREAGEGRNITVRGLGPQFTRVRVNGMEGLGTSGGTDSSGGANRSRQFDFNIFASELFNSLIVHKTAEASIDEGALGATVDLNTGRPFSYDGETIVVSAQGLYNDLSDKISPRASALYSNTWNDKTVGLLLAVSYSQRDILEEGASTVRWQNNDFASCSGCASDADFAAVNAAYHPRIPRYGRLSHDQERLGINAALQFAPGENTEIVIEGLYGSLKGTRQEQFLEALIRNNEDEMDVVDYAIDNGKLVSGTFNNAFIRVENRLDELETDFYQVTATIEHDFSDRFRADALLGTSKSKFDNPVQTTIIFDARADSYSYDYSADENLPSFDYGFNVTDPGAFEYTEFRDRPNHADNSFDTLQFNLEYDLSDELSVTMGGNWKKYEFDVAEARRDDQVADVLGASVPVTASLAGLLDGFGSGLDLPAGVDTSWIDPNIDAGAALVDLYNLPATPRSGDIRNVKEEDLGGYIQLNIDTQFGEMPFRANAGVRVVETKLESTGILSGETVVVENSYTDVLPAFNAALNVTEDFIVRGSYSKVMSRPSLGSLTPGGSIGVFGDPTLSFGNPDLAPFKADAFDVSFEWYFAEEALFSVSGFYKKIDSFIARISEDNIPFDTLGLPCSLLDASPIEGQCNTPFTVTRNVNGNGGNLKGFEVIFQTPFSWWDGFLGNMGVTTNYTYVTSEVNYAAPGEADDLGQLVGLSENAYNVTLYYEDEKFSARFAGSYRDDFLIQYPDRLVEGGFSLDFSASYALTENLDVTVEAVNLTDTKFNQRHLVEDGSIDLPYVYHHTGRNVIFGARYKF
ncbi:TonB-dependent receptor [Kordiimonas sp.]|uniref:TonB-dependent receptor n=1 Tax=Kordiimonas sp. TaxID=1970157 RepID=UPI003A95A9F8